MTRPADDGRFAPLLGIADGAHALAISERNVREQIARGAHQSHSHRPMRSDPSRGDRAGGAGGHLVLTAAAKVLAGMRRDGLRPEVYGDRVIMMAGAVAVRDQWRPLLRRHHDEIRALLVPRERDKPQLSLALSIDRSIVHPSRKSAGRLRASYGHSRTDILPNLGWG